MKINKLLTSKIKNMAGNVLNIGIIDEEVLTAIDKNNAITTCNILSNHMKFEEGKGNKTKKIYMSKLRKTFKKKKINYLICNEEEIEQSLQTFIKDSIYITKDYIYIIPIEKEKIIKKYSRYNTQIEEIECSDKTLLIINVKKAKNNKIKEFFYQIIDTIVQGIDIITDLLLS